MEETSPGAEPVWVREEVNKRPVNWTDDQYIEHMRSALARGLNEIVGPAPPRPESLLICGNGPSLAMSVARLKRLARRGHKVVACNNAYEFLKKAKVPVWAQACMDASSKTADILKHRDPIGYLLCSLCPPAAFDAVKGRSVLLWHSWAGDEMNERISREFPERPVYQIGGGCTITLRLPYVGFTMGFRDFQLYGVDSCFYGEKQYAAPHRKYEAVIKTRVGGPDGKEFTTSPQMLEQALSFQAMMGDWDKCFKGQATLSVHGEGILVEIMRQAMLKERVNA